ncbi:MAG: hypothetical protein WBR18_03285 [Anaerolineales bacterium]
MSRRHAGYHLGKRQEEGILFRPFSLSDRRRRQLICFVQILTLLTAVWLARYALHGQFGFYEDDYSLVVRGMAAPWAEVQSVLVERLTGFARQGRPLQHSLVIFLSYLVGRVGGRIPAYWLAYVIVSVNTLLFFNLMRRLNGAKFAWLSAIGYGLFSADTTQAFLYHAFGLQPALTFFMLATLAYLKGRRVLAYILGLGALMTYETAYLLLLAVPLLERRWDRSWIRRSSLNAAIVLALFGFVGAARGIAGEGRVLSLGWPDLLTTPITHMLIGPVVSLGSYLLRPVQALSNLDPTMVWWIAGGAASAVLLLLAGQRWGWPSLSSEVNRESPPVKLPFSRKNGLVRWLDFPGADRWLQLLLAGLVLVVLAYPLTFTIRAQAISGRDTRVHLGAVVGAAMVWGCIWYALLARFRQGAGRVLALVVVAGIWAGNLGFGLLVQRDYARAWVLQQRLWTSLAEQDLHWSEETTVFLDPAGLEDTTYIGANTWSMPLVAQYLYGFPATWNREPQVYRLQLEWKQRSLSNPTEFKALDTRWEFVVVRWPNVVLFNTQDGRVGQRLTRVDLNGQSYALQPQGSPLASSIPDGFLRDELVARP